MESVRWGVIGAGDVCERKSGPPLYQIDRSEMILVHRRDPVAGNDFVQRHSGRYVPTIHELVDSNEINAVYVASPHELHAEHTIAALESGKHVLVEKPMATSTADCDRMIAAAEAAGRSLGVAYYRRGFPSITRLRETVDSGELGSPLTVSINSEFPTSHRLDLVDYLIGPVTEVRHLAGGTSGYLFERMAGRIEARVSRRADGNGGSSGVAGQVVVRMSDTWTETGMPEALTVICQRGTIYLDDLKRGHASIERNEFEGAREKLTSGGLPYTHWGLVENFVSHLLDGAPLLCTGRDGRRSTVALDALAEAQKSGSGNWVRL